MSWLNVHGTAAVGWLVDGPPARLADRLVAAGLLGLITAREVDEMVQAVAQAVSEDGPGAAAAVVFGPDADAPHRYRRHLCLSVAAAVAQAPPWQPPTTARRTLQVLDELEMGVVRAAARRRPDRSVPVALADQGTTTAQMVALAVGDFRTDGHAVVVQLPASERATVARAVTLAPWALEPVTAHLDVCQHRGLGPCYRGHAAGTATSAKAISARIDRVLADAGVPATAASLRYTLGHRTLARGGPPAAMEALGFNSVAVTRRFLGR